MLPQEIIRKKRDGAELSADEIGSFLAEFKKGGVADYQMASWLMAVYWRGMSFAETSALTTEMRDSGKVFRWDGPLELVNDKHSTGGVGDKTSLVILPLAVLEGLKVPMMAGRGLGHTGGTLDKLQAIPSMEVYLPAERIGRQMSELGGVFMGQTEEIAPLDKRLYALRDVTATVESIPLITASILSKKLAEGLGGLVMDVKFGSGAFMRERAQALELAENIAGVGRHCGLRVKCLLTSMDAPLGTTAGNALEIRECVDIMKGAKTSDVRDTRELSVELTAEMVALSNPHRSMAEIRGALNAHLDSGRAFELFCRVIGAQGGDIKVLENTELLPKAPIVEQCTSSSSRGLSKSKQIITSIDVRALGVAIQELGGGRKLLADKIDPAVGLSAMKKPGDILDRGEALCVIHGRTKATVEAAKALVSAAYRVKEFVKDSSFESEPLIWKRI